MAGKTYVDYKKSIGRNSWFNLVRALAYLLFANNEFDRTAFIREFCSQSVHGNTYRIIDIINANAIYYVDFPDGLNPNCVGGDAILSWLLYHDMDWGKLAEMPHTPEGRQKMLAELKPAYIRICNNCCGGCEDEDGLEKAELI